MASIIYTPGITNSDAAQFGLTLHYLNTQSPTFAFFAPQLYGKTVNVSSQGPNMVLPASGQIFWNPSKGLQVISENGTIGVQSAAMGMVHEFGHLIFGHDEAAATAWESSIARELGEPIRANYNSTGLEIRVQNSTQHTENGVWKAHQKNGTEVTYGTYSGEAYAPYMGSGVAPPGPPVPGLGWYYGSNSGIPLFIGDYGPIDTSYPYQPPPGTFPRMQSAPEELDISALSHEELEGISSALSGSSKSIINIADLDRGYLAALDKALIDQYNIEIMRDFDEAPYDVQSEEPSGAVAINLIGTQEQSVL